MSMSSGLTAAGFAVPDAAIDAVLQPHVRASHAVDSAAWAELRAKEISNRKLGLRRWLRRLLRMGRNAREQLDVRAGYETHWVRQPTLEDYVTGLNDRALAVEWRGRGLLLQPQGLRHAHMLYLLAAIDAVKPRRVLEVGCGNCGIILGLAPLRPDVAFTGLELTEAGITTGREVQAQPLLPAAFADNSPEPVRDPTAHTRVELRTGDARALPFADRSFDLVYTRLALEQMEQIRPEALREIARVAARAVVLIEPWKDFNRADPGRAYIRRMGYFTGRIADLRKLGFADAFVPGDVPQKVQFNAGPVVAVRP